MRRSCLGCLLALVFSGAVGAVLALGGYTYYQAYPSMHGWLFATLSILLVGILLSLPRMLQPRPSELGSDAARNVGRLVTTWSGALTTARGVYVTPGSAGIARTTITRLSTLKNTLGVMVKFSRRNHNPLRIYPLWLVYHDQAGRTNREKE